MVLVERTIAETVTVTELLNGGIALPIKKASVTTSPNQSTAKSLSPKPAVTDVGT